MSFHASFQECFRLLWDFDPFPWQSMLAERVARGRWPRALDLPTASGKTACIDIAFFALASQADRRVDERSAPRRIWFVVDRRIVVDEAFERARRLAGKLEEATDGPLRDWADRLRAISGTDRPLATARLRGGVLRDEGWARLPSQPAVITSTVDQLGSRLLFRGYGRSLLAAPVFAGLAANDSLVLLDEAHCSVPFLQTAQAVEAFRGERWAERPIRTPFSFVVLSATPPPDVAGDQVFPGAEREAALGHPVLGQRLSASKPARLVEVRTKGSSRTGEDPLVREAVDRVRAFVEAGKTRVAVMVNRVRTAQAVEGLARQRVAGADVLLLTGRMRPFERDWLVGRWSPFLRSSSPEGPPRPVVLVTTQCLEVGADFSFDALVCEAASLDAMQQRFGRLHRLGRPRDAEAADSAEAFILIRDRDADPDEAEPDAVYGTALASTWKMLSERAASGSIDFGVEALRSALGDLEDLTPYLAPVGDAPVLLPAHLDLLCQTAPRPHPEPEVGLFLHGKDRGAPEARVVWRSDLLPESWRSWQEVVAVCPPVSAEMLTAPLHAVRGFLGGASSKDDPGDVEGAPDPRDGETPPEGRRFFLWRGRDRSRVSSNPSDVMPDDVVVVPAMYGIDVLGQSAGFEGLGGARLDLWEATLDGAGRPTAVRINRDVLAPWLAFPPLGALAELAEEPDPDRSSLREAIDAVLTHEPGEEVEGQPPGWWLELLREVANRPPEPHPAGGVLLAALRPREESSGAESDLFADDDDLTSLCGRSVSLDEHSEVVARTVEKLAGACLPPELAEVLREAGYWHDVGKLDERFQVMLHNGDEVAALTAGEPLAKSTRIPVSPARRKRIREAAGLPEGFRHELLSAHLARLHAPRAGTGLDRDLFLHLVASHHGHVRPFAPLCEDPAPPLVRGALGSTELIFSAEERAAEAPAHGLEAGLSDRFWRLVRAYGWWGEAYLEAILRLGDWYASGLKRERGPEKGAER